MGSSSCIVVAILGRRCLYLSLSPQTSVSSLPLSLSLSLPTNLEPQKPLLRLDTPVGAHRFVNGLAVVLLRAQLPHFADPTTGALLRGPALATAVGLSALTVALIKTIPRVRGRVRARASPYSPWHSSRSLTHPPTHSPTAHPLPLPPFAPPPRFLQVWPQAPSSLIAIGGATAAARALRALGGPEARTLGDCLAGGPGGSAAAAASAWGAASLPRPVLPGLALFRQQAGRPAASALEAAGRRRRGGGYARVRKAPKERAHRAAA